jgi:hypothetical protein
MDHNIEWL